MRQVRPVLAAGGAICVLAGFALETHNWSTLPDFMTLGLLVLGVVLIAATVIPKWDNERRKAGR